MVANPAPLMMSAKTYCSSLIEAFIPGSLPLIIARERRQRAPRCPTGSNRLSELDPTAVALVCIAPERMKSAVSAVHSMTSSARASSMGGTVRPSALAVLRFMTNSKVVDWTIGKSAGFAPFRMRPV